MCVCVCVMWNQFPSPDLTHLTEGHRISWRFIRSRSRALRRGRQTHLHTYLYNGLRSALRPCHTHHPFLASVSLALLSFPPTPPCCAALPLPLLSCFKSSSFPLSMIVPVPPLPSPPQLSSSPLPPHTPPYIPHFLLMFAVMSGRCLLRMPTCSWEAVAMMA